MDYDGRGGGSFLMALVPIVSSISLFMRDPGFSWSGCIPYILPMLVSLAVYLPSWRTIRESVCGGACMREGCRKRAPIEFTARLGLRSWANEPESVVRNFCILFWEWNRQNKTVGCTRLMEENVNINYYDEGSVEKIVPLFVDDPHSSFWHTDRPEYKYTMWMDRREDRDGRNVSEMFLRIECTRGDSQSMIEHVEFIKSEARRVTLARKQRQKVYVSTSSSGEERGRSGPEFTIYDFASTSSFANFYSDEARIVSGDLDHFLSNKQAYIRTGRPWTYTVLNEGPPGVGKTKLVKAIAARTGGTLIVLNLQHISNIQVLYDAFHSSTIAGEYIPHDTRIYYIPEVDTQMFEVLKTRRGRGAAATVEESKETTVTEIKVPTTTKPPTLGEILNVLDGVPERHGHILVLDTNHLAELDPALVRPGRVDRIISWRKMTGANVCAYLENYYSVKIPKSVTFPDNHWTAAELQAAAYHAKDWKTLLHPKKKHGIK
jgi:hypothetical protein